MPASRHSPNEALRRYLVTSQPMSSVPPMIEAMMIIENAAMVDWFMPSRSCLRAVGMRTCQNSCPGVAPDIRPDSITSGGTCLRPRMVLRTIGGKANMMLAMRPTMGPKPNSSTIGMM